METPIQNLEFSDTSFQFKFEFLFYPYVSHYAGYTKIAGAWSKSQGILLALFNKSCVYTKRANLFTLEKLSEYSALYAPNECSCLLRDRLTPIHTLRAGHCLGVQQCL